MPLEGLVKVKGNLRKFAERYPLLVGNALADELREVELPESNRKIPVDTGAAQSTGEVSGPDLVAGRISVSIHYGGDERVMNPKSGTPVADYIIPLHENLDAIHPNGEAKFLESTLKESAPYIGRRVAQRAQVDKITL